MARTLGCLVASMTAGAVVLDWAQPVGTASPPTGHQLVALVREAIQPAARAETAKHPWQAVHIESRAGDTQADATDVHAVVQRDGQWVLTNNWRDQRALGQAGVIRIGLQASPSSNQLTASQWQATTQLIQCLQQMYGIADGQIIAPDDLAAPGLPPALPLTARTAK